MTYHQHDADASTVEVWPDWRTSQETDSTIDLALVTSSGIKKHVVCSRVPQKWPLPIRSCVLVNKGKKAERENEHLPAWWGYHKQDWLGEATWGCRQKIEEIDTTPLGGNCWEVMGRQKTGCQIVAKGQEGWQMASRWFKSIEDWSRWEDNTF